MANIPEIDITELKILVIDYLQGAQGKSSHGVIEARLRELTDRLEKKCKTLYLAVSPINKDDPYVIAIAASLNIEKNTKDYEKLINGSNNLHQLLQNLYHNGHNHLEDLLNQIEAITPPHPWALYFGLAAVASVGAGTYIYLNQNYLFQFINWCKKTFPLATRWIGHTLSVLRNISIIGLIYHSFMLLWHWYSAFKYGTRPPLHKLSSRLIFETISKSFIISAYVLSYLAAGVMTPVAAILFIISSAIDVIESLYDLGRCLRTIKQNPTNWREYANAIRQQNEKQRKLNSVWVNLGAALLIMSAVIISCVLPPSIVINLSCIVFFWLVTQAKNSVITNINVHAYRDLQIELSNNPFEKDADLIPSLASKSTHIPTTPLNKEEIKNMQQRLTQLENEVQVIKENDQQMPSYSQNQHGFYSKKCVTTVATQTEEYDFAPTAS